jgi:hypothetical protein
MGLKEVISRGRFIIGLIIGVVLTGSVAYSANIFNTPETGYLLCVNQKTKIVTYPATQKCPSGTSKLILGAQGPQGEQGLPGMNGVDGINGLDGADGKNGLDGKDGLTPACDKEGQTLVLSGYKYTCITSAAGGYVWNKGVPIEPLPTPTPQPTPSAFPTRATLSNPDYSNNNVAARYTSSLAPQTIFGPITTSKSLGNSPCSNPCSGLVAGESITMSRRIQTASNPGSVEFLVTNSSRDTTEHIVATLTSGTFLDGIWAATWIVSQTITDNPWVANTQLLWGNQYATS